jgi:EthD domain
MLDGLISRESSALTVGRVHHIVEPAEGAIFTSLAFVRYPGTSVDEFRKWWLHQHATFAVRLLSPELLAYDQVHVDRVLSEQTSEVTGTRCHPYDAYGNLPWTSIDQLVCSVAKPGGREEMYHDEMGHNDHATCPGSLMAVNGDLGSKAPQTTGGRASG